MSASILEDCTSYPHTLEASQKGTPDIRAWLQWFLETLLNSLGQALARINRVQVKARFWQAHRSQTILAVQIKVLNRLLDDGERGFESGISAAQYQAVAKVSKATATRHLSDLSDLVEEGCLARLPRWQAQYALPDTVLDKRSRLTHSDKTVHRQHRDIIVPLR